MERQRIGRIIGKFSSRPFDGMTGPFGSGFTTSDIYIYTHLLSPSSLGFAEYRSAYSAIKAKVRARRSLASERETREGGGGEKRGIQGVREKMGERGVGEERSIRSDLRSRARAERAGPSS